MKFAIINDYEGKSYARNNSHNLSLLQREAKHEARVLLNLGDHRRIPLVFGVSEGKACQPRAEVS